MISFLLSMVIAVVIGFIANFLMKSSMPGRIIDLMIAGFVGAWLGTLILGNWGPVISGFAVLPAIVGATVLILLIGFMLSAELSTSAEENLLNN